jgi:hypothetical protein
MIRCRYTGESFFSGIETDAKNFNCFPNVAASAWCPHCELGHSWWKHEAWLSESPTGDATFQHSRFGWQLARIYWDRATRETTKRETPRSMGDRAAGQVGRWENVNATES